MAVSETAQETVDLPGVDHLITHQHHGSYLVHEDNPSGEHSDYRFVSDCRFQAASLLDASDNA